MSKMDMQRSPQYSGSDRLMIQDMLDNYQVGYYQLFAHFFHKDEQITESFKVNLRSKTNAIPGLRALHKPNIPSDHLDELNKFYDMSFGVRSEQVKAWAARIIHLYMAEVVHRESPFIRKIYGEMGIKTVLDVAPKNEQDLSLMIHKHQSLLDSKLYALSFDLALDASYFLPAIEENAAKDDVDQSSKRPKV